MTEQPPSRSPWRNFPTEHGHRRQWRDYATPAGKRPVKEFITGMAEADATQTVAAMRDVAEQGTRVARHLRGEIYEVRVSGDRVIYRVLFAEEGEYGQVLLALEGFAKTTRRTPPRVIDLAERRLADWRRRG